MNDSFGAIIMPRLPDTYDAKAIDDALHRVTEQLERITSRGRVQTNAVNIRDLPTSPIGLGLGDVWVDIADGALHVVI